VVSDSTVPPLWQLPPVLAAFDNLRGFRSRTIVLARAIPSEPARAIAIAARVHGAAIGIGATLVLRVWPAAPTDEDPAQDFLGPAPLAQLALEAVAAPGLARTVLLPPLPPALQLQLTAQQPALGVACRATISAVVTAIA